MAMADDDNGDGGRTTTAANTTAADDDSTRDRVADYEGEGRERGVNNNGIRACQAESVEK